MATLTTRWASTRGAGKLDHAQSAAPLLRTLTLTLALTLTLNLTLILTLALAQTLSLTNVSLVEDEVAEVENGEAPQKEAAQKAGVTQTANAEALQRAEVLRDRAREELWKGAVSGAKRDSDKLTASFAAKWNEGASAELAALRLSNPNPNPSPTPNPNPNQDEEGLRQIARVVADRGARARAVQIGIFPKGDERMAADARPALLPLRPGQAVAGTAFSFIP